MSQPLATRVHPALPLDSTEALRTRVECARTLAHGYAWGSQDAVGVLDTDPTIRFGRAYAWHVLCFVSERWHMHSNVASAWREFNATGTVTGA